jgi:hypothetical protein
MPFKSKKQMRWMFANKPAMAKKWAHKYGTKIKKGKKKK